MNVYNEETTFKHCRMKYFSFLVFAFMALIILSCNKANKIQSVTSGRINYKITYLNHNIDIKKAELLPKTMKLVFNKRQAVYLIEGFMGLYGLNTYTDLHSHTTSTLLKVFDKYYIYHGKRDELICCFDKLEGMTIRETGRSAIRAGFNCIESVIALPSSNETFVIYHTNEINLKHPNVATPYERIDGVLMEFELTLMGIKMRFTAEEYQPLDEKLINDELSKKAKDINREQMMKIIQKLME
jgi:hypothetical protein